MEHIPAQLERVLWWISAEGRGLQPVPSLLWGCLFFLDTFLLLVWGVAGVPEPKKTT